MQMNRLKRIIITATVLTSVLTINPLGTIPSIGFRSNVNAATTSVATIQADQIGWVFREHDGWLQKRRWNFTKGYWVDPNWITIRKI